MAGFPLRSFQARLIAAVVAAQLAMLALLVWQGWVLLDAELQKELRQRVEQINLMLVAATALPLAQRDYATLGDMANEAVRQKTVDYLVIKDHLGRRIVAAGWPPDRELPAATANDRVGTDGRLHFSQAVTLSEQRLGEVHYGVSAAFIDRAQTTLARGMVRLGAVGILIALVLLVPLSFWMTRRLGALEGAALRLAAGKLDERIALSGSDELSRLAAAFNQMADKLVAMIGNLRLTQARFDHAIAGSNDGIWDWDLENKQYYFSPQHKRMVGYLDSEIDNSREAMMNIVYEADRERLDRAIQRHFQERVPFDIEVRLRHKDGHLLWCRSRGQAIWSEDGHVRRFSGATTDITQQKNAEAALAHLAHHDGLTRLPNRTLLTDRIAMALANARRNGGRVAVALLDLDGFKPVNDTHGHEAGDKVLCEVASRLRAAVREADTVARLGGDEFVVVLTGIDGDLEYEHTLHRLLALLAQPYAVAGTVATLSASIGATVFPDDNATDADTLIRHADQAMYIAKQGGRNRYHVFDAVVDRAVQLRHDARNRVVAALAADEFCLFFQPKVDLRRGRVIGVEALIRWQHPERGLMPPGEFLPLIQGSEFEILLSEWVIEAALAQMARWRTEGLDLTISVNLPAQHLQDAGFTDFLAALLSRQPAGAGERLELEVLESVALEDVAGVSARMRQCCRMGIRFALDDFGTGYASLAYLSRLPIEVLKIDQSFVRNMLHDTDDLAIVEGVIGLASAFRDTAIAEGVETIEHAVMLLHLGCDLAQGYGIARPMPPERIPAWIADWVPDPALTAAAKHVLRRQDLALALVEVEHRQWVDNIIHWRPEDDGLASGLPSLDVGSCRFGRWLLDQGNAAYGQVAEFRLINSIHDQVHATGSRMVGLRRAGDEEAARALVPALQRQRDLLVEQLHRLVAVIGVDADAAGERARG